MTTTNLTKMTESEFKSKVAKQKDRQSTLMSLTAGECVVETEGTGNNKKAVIYGVPYTDRKGQPQTYPAVAVGNNAVALTALQGKDSLTQSDGTVVPLPMLKYLTHWRKTISSLILNSLRLVVHRAFTADMALLQNNFAPDLAPHCGSHFFVAS